MKSAALAEASRMEAEAKEPGYVKDGSPVNFSLREWMYDGRPYVMATLWWLPDHTEN